MRIWQLPAWRSLPEVAARSAEPADPLAARSPFLVGAFRLYLRWYFWRSFHGVRLSRTGIPAQHAGRRLVIYCNHPSWWDPALLLLTMPKMFPERRGCGPIDQAQLVRYGLFTRMGMFGVDTKTAAGARAFLRTSQMILDNRTACLCITAEGRFTDARARPISLMPGLAHLARRLPDIVFLPLALEYTFWNESRPEVLMRFGTPVIAPETGSVAAWQASLEASLTEAMDALAAESLQRTTTNFISLFEGTAGVGGIYDLWRRAVAAASGKSFDPRHEPGAQ
jgi:1-acyl-sn-glycerol-3-phosphate acyltransferase